MDTAGTGGDKTAPSAAFIGLGRWGRVLVRAFGECGVAPAGFLAAGSERTLEWIAEHHPTVPVARNLIELLSIPSSIAVVASPRATHAQYAASALCAGRHVWVEKPPASTGDQVAALAVRAAEQRLQIHTAFTYLFHPAFDHLVGDVGPNELAVVTSEWNRPNAPTPVVWELLPHDLALTIRLTGYVPGDVAIEGDAKWVRCRWHTDQGTRIDIRIDGTRGPKQKRLVVQSLDNAVWEWCDARLRCPVQRRLCLDEYSYSVRAPLANEVRWFLGNLADSESSVNCSALAVAVVRLIERAVGASPHLLGDRDHGTR